MHVALLMRNVVIVTQKGPQSPSWDPMHGLLPLLQKETGQDLPLGTCQPSSLISPGATQNDWRHSLPPPTNCTSLSQPCLLGSPTPGQGKQALLLHGPAKIAISQAPEIFIFIQAGL